MRVQTLPILATIVLGVMLLSGVVLAETKICHNNCQGTNGSDYLKGDGSNNQIYGLGGKDYVGGKAAADTLFGGTGNDEVAGGSGKDRMKGGSGVDTLWGRPGYDSLSDQPEKGSFALLSQHGAYQVQASRKPDRLLGGPGNDTLRAKDGTRDIISGGLGYDKAYVDRVDTVTGVEVERCPGGCNPQPKPKPIAPQKTQCEDSKDNDGDGKRDLQDPGCASANDNTENAPPVANNDTLSTCCGYPEDINVINNPDPAGVDTDADGDNLRVSRFTQPSHGKVTRYASSPDEKLLYTPKDGFPSCNHQPPCPDGTDSFHYTVSDGHGGTDTGTVDVTVDAPQCVDGEDNDNDTYTDLQDPECASKTDDNEYQ